LSGPANVQVFGGGVAEFSGNNTFAGAAIVSGYATLILNNANALGFGGYLRVQGTGEYDGGGTAEVADGITIPLLGIDAPVGGGALTLTSAGSGIFQLQGNISLATSSGGFGGSVTVNGNVDLPSGTHSFVLPSGASVTLGTTAVVSGSGAIDSSGQGETFFIDPNSTFSGGVTIEGGNTAYIAGNSTTTNGALTSGPLGTGTLNLESGAFVTMSTANYNMASPVVSNPVSLNGTVTLTGITLSGPISLGPGTTTIESGGVTLSGPISGNSAAGITFAGGYDVVLSGDSTFSGPLIVSANTIVEVSSPNALGSPSIAATVDAGGALNIEGITIAKPIFLSGSSTTTANLGGEYSSRGTVTGAVTFSTAAYLSGIVIDNDITDVSPAGVTGTLLVGGFWTVQANHVHGGALTIGSTLLLTPSSAGPVIALPPSIDAPSDVRSLTISSGAMLDLTNNIVMIDYGSNADPISTIAGYLKTGYANGQWNGLGIDSSSAAANPRYGIGYADGADHIVAGLSSGQIEVAYTLYGDANLDGLVNGDDFTILTDNLGKAVSGWDKGDFNYDGLVNGDDFTLLTDNLGKAANGATVILSAADYAAIDAIAAANGLMADVPEPASASILAISFITMFARQRRRILPT
jgi:hypothetical protein